MSLLFSIPHIKSETVDFKKEIVKIVDLKTSSYDIKVYFNSDKRDSIEIDFNYFGEKFLCRDDGNYDYFISNDRVVINNLFDEHIIAQKIRTKYYSEKFEIPDTIKGFNFTLNLYDYDEFFSLTQKLNLLEGMVNNDYSFYHNQDYNLYHQTKKKIKISISLDKIKSNEIRIVDLKIENSIP